MAAVLAALLCFLPGLGIAVVSRPDATIGSWFRRGIVWSVVITSAVAWLPFGSRIPLDLWFFLMTFLSLASLAVFAIYLRRSGRQLTFSLSAPDVCAVLVLAIFAFILMVRANIDWDAVNYYLYPAVGFTLADHYTNFLPASITFGQHAPNASLPAMPVIYALAILAAQHLHDFADNAVRLIALVFVGGTYLAARSIASRYLPRTWASAAALMYLLMPATITIVVGAPLYLDLCFTYLCSQFVAELLEPGRTRLVTLQVAVTASAIVLSKVDGLPFVALVLLILAASRIRFGRVLMTLTSAAMIAAAVALHLFAKSGSVQLAVAILIAATLAIASVHPKSRPWLRSDALAALGIALLGFVPALLGMANLSRLTGSPAGFYLPSLAVRQSAGWHEAFRLITRADIFAASTQPGLPANFGLGLLLWWGFAPPLMILSVIGLVISVRRGEGPLLLASVLSLFSLAFLTIFALDDFRHLLPITPLLPVLALYGVRRIARSAGSRAVIAGIAVLASYPFAWTAQQRFFDEPFPLLQKLFFDQWQALSGHALLNIALYVAALASLAAMLLVPVFRYDGERRSVVEFLGTALRRTGGETARHAVVATAVVATEVALIALFLTQGFALWLCLAIVFPPAAFALTRYRVRNLYSIVAGALLIVLWFEPVVATAVTQGFPLKRSEVEAGQDGGYLPALRLVFGDPSIHAILTYGSYGISWFSLGHVRKADLTDATDVATILPALRSENPEALFDLGIGAAILPSDRPKPLAAFTSIVRNLDARAVDAMRDPLLAFTVAPPNSQEWAVTTLLPKTTTPLGSDAALYAATVGGDRLRNVTAPFARPLGQIRAFAMRLPRSFPQDRPVSVEVRGFEGDGSTVVKTVHGRFLVAPRSGFVAIDTAGLTLPLGGRFPATTVIRSIAISPAGRSSPMLDFRTEGFTLQDSSGNLQRFPFVLHADAGIVNAVRIAGDSYDLPIWGAANVAAVRRLPRVLELDLRSSTSCPAGSPVLATAELAVRGDDPSQFAISRVATRFRLDATTVVIPIEPHAPDWATAFTVSSLQLRGTAATCNLDERFTSPSLSPKWRREHLTAGTLIAIPLFTERISALNVPYSAGFAP